MDDELLIEQTSNGDPRRCPHHPEVQTSSPSGLFDAPCHLCEAEMDTAMENDCTCYLDCREDSHSGRWHQHEGEPCPVHPDAPVVG
jgi:hypothetical protein